MASALGLNIGDSTNAPLSQPTPLTGNKHMVSGSTPQPAQPAKRPTLPSIPDTTSRQAPSMDIITLTAALQTAMQPFIARLAAIETSVHRTQPPQPNSARAEEQTRPAVGQTAPDGPRPTAAHPPADVAWTQVTNKKKKGKTGKPEQANPTLQQVNLTPQSYAAATTTPAQAHTATAARTPNQLPIQNQQTHSANPPPRCSLRLQWSGLVGPSTTRRNMPPEADNPTPS